MDSERVFVAHNVHHFDPLQGTLVCENGTCLLYWSPDVWRDPNTALRERLGVWRFVNKDLRGLLVTAHGKSVIPQHPGEYTLLDDWPPTSTTDENVLLDARQG